MLWLSPPSPHPAPSEPPLGLLPQLLDDSLSDTDGVVESKMHTLHLPLDSLSDRDADGVVESQMDIPPSHPPSPPVSYY